MLRLSNIGIGIKLGIMSGLGVFLVVTMLVASMYGASNVEKSNAKAILEHEIQIGLGKIELTFAGARLTMRNIRIAENADDLQKSNNLAALQKRVDGEIQAVIDRFTVAENRERLKKIHGYISEYIGVALKELIPLKSAELAANQGDAARIADLNKQMDKLQHERLDPEVAAGMELVREIGKIADQLSAEAHSAAMAQSSSTRNIDLAIGVAVALILIGAAVFSVFTIARPLKALVQPLETIASGNFAVDVPGAGRKDEVGQIANAVAEMAQKVSSTIGEIKSSGREVTNASAEISTSTTDLSQRTEEQAASLEETSAAMEELSATVRKNAENARLANTDAATTRDVADRGGKVVAQAVEAMAKIEDSSRKISDIIGVIDEIARQTNLLALNAAVEAARAGEAGRGFAVVASEVRSLAQRSSQAAKDIKDLITNSNGQVKDGVELVNKAGESLTEIVESIKKVAVVVSDIANASIEQATGIEQINKALNQMDEATQQNSALVEENAATAKTLEHQAKAMDQQVAFFQIAVGDDSHGFGGTASHGHHSAPTFKPAPRKAARSAVAAKPSEPPRRAAASAGPARTMQTALASAVNAEDWKEF
jgi:methyl-accepting chemotaxis protein